jgi:hypothetical protein
MRNAGAHPKLRFSQVNASPDRYFFRSQNAASSSNRMLMSMKRHFALPADSAKRITP